MSQHKYLDYEGLERLSEYIKERLIVINQISDIPESPSDGDVILYMGETAIDFDHGCLYSYVEEDEAWKLEATDIKIKLNGEETSGLVEIYAPTQSGSPGQFLASGGENEEPIWTTIAGYNPHVIEDTLLFSLGVLPTVEDNSLVFDV